MSAYVLSSIKVNNPDNYKEYVTKVKSIVEKFGGEYLVRGGEMTVIEGEWNNPRSIVIKFQSKEKAMEWYNSDEYNQIKNLSLENAESNIISIKG